MEGEMMREETLESTPNLYYVAVAFLVHKYEPDAGYVDASKEQTP
jgi:hypothetical protein